jgi:COP9 signalosome complex subunit 7
MASVNEITDGGVHLQQFLTMGKNLKDSKAVAGFVKQVLSSPNVFVFGEILELEGVKQLEKGDDEAKQHFELLNIFAYGTYSNYKANEAKLPKLTKQQLTKLKQLSIVSMAAENRIISYKALEEKIDISNVRELEDLIIDCIYQGIIIGRLDQGRGQLEVEHAIGRDLRPGQIDSLLTTLSNWSNSSEQLMKTIEEKISWAKTQQDNAKRLREAFEKQIEETKANLKVAMDADAMDTQYEGGDMDDGRKKRGGQGGKSKPPKQKGRNSPFP